MKTTSASTDTFLTRGYSNALYVYTGWTVNSTSAFGIYVDAHEMNYIAVAYCNVTQGLTY